MCPLTTRSCAGRRRHDWKWQAVPMDPALLPDLVPPAGRLGEITPEAAEATGIPAGLPLIAAAADKACEVIGAGCLEPHIGCLSYGTTATINTTHRKVRRGHPPDPALSRRRAGPLQPGDPDLSRLLDGELVQKGVWPPASGGSPRSRGSSRRTLFDELVNQVPPGSMGLTLQPYWSPGLKVPGPEAKGAIIGFGDVHTRAHLYRAILEGLAYALREGKERTERRSRVPITELRVAGGGSQSDAAMQLTADIFGLPTARPHTYEASGLGAAIDAAVGLGLHPDFDAAVRRDDARGRLFEPDAQQPRDLRRAVPARLQSRCTPSSSRCTRRFAKSPAIRPSRVEQAASRRPGTSSRTLGGSQHLSQFWDTRPGSFAPSL